MAKRTGRPVRLYLAGPLFSTAEKAFNVELAIEFRKRGYEVFLPQEHEQRSDRPGLIFASDKNGIDWADAVVANLDGADPDSGTCWEAGYGFAKDKMLVVYRTDFRLFAGSDKVNLMLTESADKVVIAPTPSVPALVDMLDSVLVICRRGPRHKAKR